MSWRQELLDLSARFAAEWPAAEPDVPVRWPGEPTLAPASAPWLRFAVVPVAARAVGFVQDGRRLHRHDGLVTIDVFAPPGEGRARLLELADRAAAILRGWAGPHLRCGTPSLSVDAAAEGWARASLAVPFARDTLF